MTFDDTWIPNALAEHRGLCVERHTLVHAMCRAFPEQIADQVTDSTTAWMYLDA